MLVGVMSAQTIYLNHAGTSWPKPPSVIKAVQDAMIGSPNQWGEHFARAHLAIADYFNVSDPEQLLLTPGCTSSLAVGMSDIDLVGRKRVLTSAWEHHALHRPLLKLSASGINVDYIPPSTESPLDLNKLEEELMKGDVGLVAITAAANVTGDLLPFQEAIALAHQHNAQALVDAAQVVGWLDLDFAALEADLIAFGGHKGLQGPWGIGGLYIGDGARLNCSSASCELPSSNQSPRPGYCDVGSVDQVALAGLHAAVDWLSDIDQTTALETARKQTARLESAVNDTGARCVSIQGQAERMPTVAFSVDGRTSSDVAAALKSVGIIAGSGLQCARLAHQTVGTENQGLVRLSVGIGQDDFEIKSAADLISEVLVN